jgi:8-oxo-dGTP diphosphatase
VYLGQIKMVENMASVRKKPNINTSPVDISKYFGYAVSVDCVIFGFDENTLKVLLIKSDLPEFRDEWSLLGDLVGLNEDLDSASYRVLKERTGLKDVYLEQVHTFSAIDRHPAGRVVSTAYFSLVNVQHYHLSKKDHELHWHPVEEIKHMAFDHKLILDTCLNRLQEKVKTEPIIFNLLEKKFSLRQLQYLYEAVLGIKLDRRNFRKKLFATGFITDINEMEENVPHRPGKLYTFNYSKYKEGSKKNIVAIDF